MSLRLLATLACLAMVSPASAPEASPARSPAGKSAVAIERVRIPGGAFIKGSNKHEDDERPRQRARVAAFSIHKTEVTRAAYAACVAARKCRVHPAMALDEPGGAQLPVTSVSWADASAYCAFERGRLPTEAQWEKAARGRDGRIFPWGDEADCARANWGNFEGEGPCGGSNPGRPVAVGRYPSGASPFGVMDMGGNVWEWTRGRYEDDPERRVVRGGSCCSYFVGPRASNRNAWHPSHRDGDLGFRCAFPR